MILLKAKPGQLSRLNLGFITLLAGGLLFVGCKSVIPINDISTDTLAPLSYFASQQESGIDPGTMAYDSAFIEQQKQSYPYIQPLRISGDPGLIYSKALKIAKTEFNWQIVAQDPQNMRFQALARTKVFKFKDDIVVQVRSNGEQSIINMRSRSRLGKSDLGANARRIKDFLEAL